MVGRYTAAKVGARVELEGTWRVGEPLRRGKLMEVGRGGGSDNGGGAGRRTDVDGLALSACGCAVTATTVSNCDGRRAGRGWCWCGLMG